jgi:hypothetical protein
MTFSAGSRRTSRRRRTAAQPTAAAARRARSTSARSTQKTATATPASTRRPAASTRTKRSFQDKLQPMVLRDLPSWLRSLIQVQRGVWLSTVALSAIALGTYGWSVYSQQQWGMAYNQLQRLQRNERQLISGSEMMKNQIAQQVDPKSLGLAPPKFNDVIFIKPEAPNRTSNPAAPGADPTAVKPNQPLGY